MQDGHKQVAVTAANEDVEVVLAAERPIEKRVAFEMAVRDAGRAEPFT